MSISSLLFVSRDLLQVSQMAMDVTGANIANVNTPGYSRQRALINSNGGNNLKSGIVQTGVSIDQVQRQYDQYLENQLVLQRQNTGFASTLNDRLTSIESIFDESQNGGLTDQLNKFWSSWESLSANPSGQVERGTVTANAQSLSVMVSNISKDLVNVKADIQSTIKDTIATVNVNVSQIRDLNERISNAGTGVGDTNILQDKLVALIGDLGERIGINWSLNADGTANVYLPDGTSLVERLASFELKTVNSDGAISIYPVKGVREESLNGTIASGTLAALIRCQDEIVPKYQERINAFAQTLADGVNEQHRKGYDSNKNVGVDFFSYSQTNPAASLSVNPDIIADLRKIAASDTVSGGGGNATHIANIQNSLLLVSNSFTLNAYYGSTVGDIGREVADSKTDLAHQQDIMENVSTRRESVSGVSLDEEMINLMKYQMSYSAAGRLAQTVNSMLETLMSLGGTTT